MTVFNLTGAGVLAFLMAAAIGAAGVTAQEQKGDAGGAQRPIQAVKEQENRKIALQVQVVVSRYRGDARISSMPYILAVNAQPGAFAEPARLRMGARVPVPALQPTTSDAKGFTSISPVTYQDIGTNIDCSARSYPDGTFELRIGLEDMSLYASAADPQTPAIGEAPVFRTFQSNNNLILRDGQSRQFTAATDRVNGEVVRVEVTLTVVK